MRRLILGVALAVGLAGCCFDSPVEVETQRRPDDLDRSCVAICQELVYVDDEDRTSFVVEQCVDHVEDGAAWVTCRLVNTHCPEFRN